MTTKPKPSLRSQFFRDYQDKFNRKVFKQFNMPWMKSKELDIIEEVILNVKPAHCLEWGSGYSTIILPKLLPDLKTWNSIEHNKEWHEFIAKRNTDPRVTITLIEPDDKEYMKLTGKYDAKKEGLYEDFKTYIEFPESLGHKFDFIFIDGRARRECIKKAHSLLSENGVIIVHDANRDDYFNELPSLSSTFRLTDYRKHRKQGGVWIGRKAGDVADVLDVAHHTKIWKQHDMLAKVFFLR
jgi:predicted O-methyltransferase YrrM